MSYSIAVILFFFGSIIVTAGTWLAFSKYNLLSKKQFWFITISIAPTLGMIGLLVTACLKNETFAAVAAILSFFPSLILSLVTVLVLDQRYR